MIILKPLSNTSNMKIKYFAWIKDITNKDEEMINEKHPKTINELKKLLCKLYPDLEKHINNNTIRYAVNMEYTSINKKLEFHIWDKSFLKNDLEGIPYPDNHYLLNPTELSILFIPCLSIDKEFYRLGYGGGYYDKTFDFLRNNNKKFISVGYAFDDQKVPEVPKDKFDIRLDYVITEKKLYSFI